MSSSSSEDLRREGQSVGGGRKRGNYIRSGVKSMIVRSLNGARLSICHFFWSFHWAHLIRPAVR